MSDQTELIIEALSWSETFEDGRLGYQRAFEILAEHDRQVRDEVLRAARDIINEYPILDCSVHSDEDVI